MECELMNARSRRMTLLVELRTNKRNEKGPFWMGGVLWLSTGIS
jgi:hypothetical protein